MICCGKNILIVTVSTSHTPLNIICFIQQLIKVLPNIQGAEPDFFVVFFHPEIFLQSPEASSSLQVLFQTGFPVPTANNVEILEVRPSGDRGDGKRALTGI